MKSAVASQPHSAFESFKNQVGRTNKAVDTFAHRHLPTVVANIALRTLKMLPLIIAPLLPLPAIIHFAIDLTALVVTIISIQSQRRDSLALLQHGFGARDMVRIGALVVNAMATRSFTGGNFVSLGLSATFGALSFYLSDRAQPYK